MTSAQEYRLVMAAHIRAAARYGAEFRNFGWVATQTSTCSKTSAGILTTKRFAKGKYIHTLEAY
jgi:hypothetical protein